MIVRRLQERLEAVSPMSVLNRGYTIVYSEDGAVLQRKANAILKEKMKVRFADGEIEVYQNGRKTGNVQRKTLTEGGRKI